MRFHKNNKEWVRKKIGEISSISSGGTPSRGKYEFWGGNIPWITTSLIDFNEIQRAEEYITKEGLNQSSAKLFPKGTILMAMYGQGKTRGKVAILGIEATTNQACAAIKVKQGMDARFLYTYLEKEYDRIRNIANDGGQQNLSASLIKSYKISLPNLNEQVKISSFLLLIDRRINTQIKIIEQLETLMSGLRQKIFSRQLRFKDDEGNDFPKWEEKNLIQLASRIISKNKENNQNVLTISAQQGLISQLKFFNKSVAAKDLKGYYLMKNNDFAYNKSYSDGYPMGAIKKLTRYDNGVVSSLYICFRFNAFVNTVFMEHYFESGLHNREIEKYAQEGARNHGLLNIGIIDFFNTKISIPNTDEQTKIANFLSSFDKKIEAEKEILIQYQSQKKYFLQNLFI